MLFRRIAPQTDSNKCGRANCGSKSPTKYEKCERCTMEESEGVSKHERCRSCKIHWGGRDFTGRSFLYAYESSDSAPQPDDQVFKINHRGEFKYPCLREKKLLIHATAIKDSAVKLRAEYRRKILAQANDNAEVLEDEYGHPLEQTPKS